MWDFIITCKKTGKNYIKIIKEIIEPELKDVKGICTELDTEEECKLLIACTIDKKPDIIKLLDEVISEIFVSYYKENYLKNNLKKLQVNNINLQAFIKALVYFDKEYDKQFVKQKLCYKDNLYLESFFAFKLTDLKNKWHDICTLTNDNSMFLNADDTFLELLKFLIESLKIKNETVNVIYKDNTYKFLSDEQKELSVESNDEEQNDIFLITSLISLSPKNINIYSDGTISVKTLELINDLFLGRVNLCKNKQI